MGPQVSISSFRLEPLHFTVHAQCPTHSRRKLDNAAAPERNLLPVERRASQFSRLPEPL